MKTQVDADLHKSGNAYKLHMQLKIPLSPIRAIKMCSELKPFEICQELDPWAPYTLVRTLEKEETILQKSLVLSWILPRTRILWIKVAASAKLGHR